MFNRLFAFFNRITRRSTKGSSASTQQNPREPEITASQEQERSFVKTVVELYRTTNEAAGVPLVFDKIGQGAARVNKAMHKIGWAVAHPKLAAVSFWHSAAGAIAKAAACLSTPGVIAIAVVVAVGAACIIARMHGAGII